MEKIINLPSLQNRLSELEILAVHKNVSIDPEDILIDLTKENKFVIMIFFLNKVQYILKKVIYNK